MIARSLPVHWLRAVAVLGGLTLCATAWALSGKEMIDLRQAGIDSDTLALVVSEKVVESGTFSVGELVQMRQAGLSNETIATAVRAGAMDDRSPVIVYGRHVEPLQLGNIQDLLRLKAAGGRRKSHSCFTGLSFRSIRKTAARRVDGAAQTNESAH